MVFLTLHPFNLLVALVARMFGPVAFWRVEGVPAWLQTPFEPLEPRAFFDAAQWNELLQDAHVALARQITVIPVLRFSILGLSADVGPLWLHWLAHEFEADCLGQHLAAAWARRRQLTHSRMFRSGVASWTRAAVVTPASVAAVERLSGSVLADRLWEIAKSIRHAVAVCAQCILAPVASVDVGGHKFRYVFAGIVPSRRPYQFGRLDFTFLVRRGLLPPGDCLYVPARPIDEVQRAGIAVLGAEVIAATALAGLFSWRERVRMVLQIAATTFRSIVRLNGPGDALAGMFARGLPMVAAAQHLGVKVFVAGLDQGLLEPPATPFLSAAGVRTITWQHALVGFAHGPKDHEFRNRILEQSVFAADEVCVWTPADRDLLEDRALDSQRPSRIHVTGPLMPGDCRSLDAPPEGARRAIGLDPVPGRRIATVFDLPTFMVGVRRQYRIPINRIPVEAHDAFFADLWAALDQFPDLDFILKPKRGEDRGIYRGRSYAELTDTDSRWIRSGRVHVLEADVDPHLPIAAADICIGMPFTSPVVAGLNAGRPSFWYDPIGFVAVTWPPSLEEALVRGRPELFECLARTYPNDWVAPADLLAYEKDAAQRFAGIIAGQTTTQGHVGHLIVETDEVE